MSWVITPTFYGFIADADAKDYLARVHAAEGQTLEPAVALAVEAFVVGCKADGIWTAIKASCILAGARTLAGTLVPLVGTAPTNVGGLFVSGDYNRKTGLVGNGSTKYLNSNRNNNADPQNSKHASVYVSSLPTTSGTPMLGQIRSLNNGATFIYDNSTKLHNVGSSSYVPSVGFIGISRGLSASYILRTGASGTTVTVASLSPLTGNITPFFDGNPSIYSDARLAFYSIGESLNLALLDARVTTLINAFDAAI
jgi:hypothetical protein